MNLDVATQSWNQKSQGIGSSSVFRFRIGCATHLHENLRERYTEIRRAHRNKKIFISREIASIDFWPDDCCLLFKLHYVPIFPVSFWLDSHPLTLARVAALPMSQLQS